MEFSIRVFARSFRQEVSISHPGFPQNDPAFAALLALFAAPAGERLKPIGHPSQAGIEAGSLRQAAVLIPVTRPSAGTRRASSPGPAAANLGSTAGASASDAGTKMPADSTGTALESENATVSSQVTLTVRSENLRSHAGQISLPGGSIEPEDADPAATALREAEEEIGLPRSQVEVIGQLGPMALPSGFLVTPVVGLISPAQKFTPCSREVADIFQTPLSLILNLKAYIRTHYHQAGKTHRTLELPYKDYQIWGATAAILHRLAVLCSADKEIQATRA